MTYTIGVRCPETGAIGLATCSNSAFLASKSLHRSTAGVPALVASQSFSSRELGAAVLAELQYGAAVADAGLTFLADDPQSDLRQLVIVTGSDVRAWTGSGCVPESASLTTDDRTVAAAGNMLADAAVVERAARATADATGDLSDRLLAGLRAGHAAGGDFRGDRSAALTVAVPQQTDVAITVGDDPDPITELARLLDVSRADAVVRRATQWALSGATQPPADLDAALADAEAVVGTTATIWRELIADSAPGDTAADRLRSLRDIARRRIAARRDNPPTERATP